MQPKVPWPQSCEDVFAEPQSSLNPDAGTRNSVEAKNAQEHGHVLHESAEVKDGHQNGEEGAPHAGPEVERHELQVTAGCKVVDHQRVRQEGPRSTQDGQGLPCEGGEKQAGNCCRHDHLEDPELPVGAIQEAAPKPGHAKQLSASKRCNSRATRRKPHAACSWGS